MLASASAWWEGGSGEGGRERGEEKDEGILEEKMMAKFNGVDDNGKKTVKFVKYDAVLLRHIGM